MEAHGEPKITVRYAAHFTRQLLTVAFSFMSMGMAVAIIGLAADNINWGTGRGSEDANTVVAVVLGKYDEERDHVDRWVTKMSWVPYSYETPTFVALLVAASVCILGGCVAAPLSILFWRSGGQSVELGRRRVWPQHWTLLICLIFESIQFLTTLVVLIYVRELYSQETGYNPYDIGDAYRIAPQYFDPALPPPPPPNATYSRQPMDDVYRYYASPMQYNPLNWNCRLQGHVTSSKQHRLFQLCEEGNAARWLLVAMFLLQGIVLASHAFAWVGQRRGGNVPWTQQRLRSEENEGETESE